MTSVSRSLGLFFRGSCRGITSFQNGNTNKLWLQQKIYFSGSAQSSTQIAESCGDSQAKKRTVKDVVSSATPDEEIRIQVKLKEEM